MELDLAQVWPYLALAAIGGGAAGWLARAAAQRHQAQAAQAASTQMTDRFQALAFEALRANQTHFLELANETFAKHKQAADADLKSLVKPLAETLKAHQEHAKEIERARQEAYGAIAAELKQVVAGQAAVRDQAGRLVNALKAAPKTRGRWGEEQLRNVMELAGMAEHVDFSTQVTVDGDIGRLMPDAVIHLPGGRHLVVDAKTSMSAYLDALDATDDDARERLLTQHARQIRTHMQQLGGKKYWAALPVTPDFVAMFIPGENFFAAAMERDADLFQDGVNNRVFIVTPTTLIALAKVVAFGWRQEKMADNARIVADLGAELYRRMAALGGHVLAMGRSLEGTVGYFNKLVGSLENNVLPQARRFRDLGIEGAREPLAELEAVAAEPRTPTPGRDLDLKEKIEEEAS